MATQLLASKSIDLLAARFDITIPEIYPGENLFRATTLFGGSVSDLRAELLKIVFYLASNNLILDDFDTITEESQLVIGLCRLSGLTRPDTLKNLVRLSHSSATLTGIINFLYTAAINAEAADVVSLLLRIDSRINPDGRVKFSDIKLNRLDSFPGSRITPILFAVYHGSISLFKVLLDAGANIHQEYEFSEHRWPLTAIAIFGPDASRAVDIARMLLQRGLNINVSERRHITSISCLQAAIMTGNRYLIDELVAKGADLNQMSKISVPNRRHSRHGLRFCITNTSCLGLAASYGAFEKVSRTTRGLISDRDQYIEYEEKALELCEELLSKYRRYIVLSECLIRDAVVQAVAQGYVKVVSFFGNLFPAALDPVDGQLPLLHIAVASKMVGACTSLLELGLSPNITCTMHYDNWLSNATVTLDCPIPTGYVEITAHKPRYGATQNTSCDVCVSCCCRRSTADCSHSNLELSALYLAILLGCQDIAALLLSAGATATAEVLLEASGQGQLQLVKKLAQTGISPDIFTDYGARAYQIALSNGHEAVAAYLAASGITIEPSLSIWRLPDIKLVQASLGQILQGRQSSQLDADGRSYLENAILSGNEAVMAYAFSIDKTAYDSGALCAAVRFHIQILPNTELTVLGELLHRRNNTCDPALINPFLENVAVSLAACCQRLDMVLLLLQGKEQSASASCFTRVSALSAKCKETIMYQLTCQTMVAKWKLTSGTDWHSNGYGDFPLFYAVFARSEKIAFALLDADYEVDSFTLKIALKRQLSWALIKRLILKCIDINAKCLEVQYYFQIPLYWPIYRGNLKMVKALLDYGADANAEWMHGNFRSTALVTATETGDLQLVNFLLDRGADPKMPIWTPKMPFRILALTQAARQGYIGLVRHLLSHGAELNARRCLIDNSPLEAAAVFGRLDMVKLLLELGTYTQGLWRIQYIEAVWQAAREGHGAVEGLLRTHRPWTEEDEVIWRRLDYNDKYSIMRHDTQLIHPEELNPGELVELVAELDKEQLHFGWYQQAKSKNWRKRVAMQILEEANAVALSSHAISRADALDQAIEVVTIALEEFDASFSSKDYAEDVANFEADIDDNPDDDTSDDGEVEVDSKTKEDMKASLGWFDHPNYIGAHADQIAASALQKWASSLVLTATNIEPNTSIQPQQSPAITQEYTDVHAPDHQNADSELPVSNESSNLGGSQEQQPVPDNLVPFEDNEDWEATRRSLFARDMAGEEEAPFVPMIWEA